MVTRSTTSRVTRPTTSAVGDGVSGGRVNDADALAYFAAAEAADADAFDLTSTDATYTAQYTKAGHNALFLALKGQSSVFDIGNGTKPTPSNLWAKITELYNLGPIASLTALAVKMKGSGSLALSNFVDGDLLPVGTNAGLKGNGTTKQILTGATYNTADNYNWSHFAYITEFATGNFAYYGAFKDAAKVEAVGLGVAGTNGTGRYFADGIALTAGAGFKGFLTGITRANNDHEIYGNGASANTSASTSVITELGGSPLWLYSLGGNSARSNGRKSVYGYGKSMTDSEVEYLAWCFNAWARYFNFSVFGGPGEIFLLGDSTVADYLGAQDVLFYTTTDLDKIVIADPGDTIAQQKTLWTAAAKINPAVVIIQIGHNDIGPSTTAGDVIADLQDLVNTVATDAPSASILIATMTPARQRYIDLYGATDGATTYQQWLDVNAAIRGDGGTPITGVDGRISSHTDDLNDGSGNLDAAYDVGDSIHVNAAGRAINGAAYTTALNAI